MKLSEEQVLGVSQVLETGGKVSDVQKFLSDKYKINLTYMEVKFLLADLDLSPKEVAKVADEVKSEKVESGNGIVSEEDSPNGEMDNSGGEGISVDLDKVQIPGVLASGNVKFSDGVDAKWRLDEMGRLALIGPTKEYRPSESDIGEFQARLRQLLSM